MPIRRIYVLWVCLMMAMGGVANAESLVNGKSLAEGGVTRLAIPTLPHERELLLSMQVFNPDVVDAAIALPENFDPGKSHPILLIQVTADRYRPNIEELEAYRETALRNGYLVLTAQGRPWPRSVEEDTRQHRYTSMHVALRWLAEQYPASREWPLVLAGFSGGAKIIQPLAALLLMEHRTVIGLFLGGCNAEFTDGILQSYPEVAGAYINIAFFLSSGRSDIIATPRAMRAVAKRLERAGVKKLRLSRYAGGHHLDVEELDSALKWFLQPEPARQ